MDFDLMQYAAIIVAGAVVYILLGIANLRKSKKEERWPTTRSPCPSSGC